MLYGGVLVVFVEILGLVVVNFSVGEDVYCVGLDINVNYVCVMCEGLVMGIVVLLYIGVLI